jgi:putative endonuclease
MRKKRGEREARRVDEVEPRRSREELGRHGEALAAAFLRRRGFRILARNLRTATGEVDILARQGDVLVAVEVKTRRDHFAPELTVRPAQLARLERTLSRLAPLQRRRPGLLRVDVVAVRATPADTPDVRHFEGTPFPP